MNTVTTSLNIPALINRTKLVALNPKTCWDTVAADVTPPNELTKKFVLPLVVLGGLATVIGLQVFGITVPNLGTWRPGLFSALFQQVLTVVMMIVSFYVNALVMSKLAAQFKGNISYERAFSLEIHAALPALAIGLLAIVPWIPVFLGLPLGIYSLYLLFQGARRMVTIPQERFVAFFIVYVVVSVLVSFLAMSVVFPLTPSPFSDLGSIGQ